MKNNIMLIHEITPNPNAIRIISNIDFRVGESVTFKEKADIPLVDELFDISGIKEVFLLDNFITVTKNKEERWESLIIKIKNSLENMLPFHDPEFKIEKKKAVKEFPPGIKEEVEKIEKILDQKVRPALQSDGGDLMIEDFKDNVLTIFYTGACGSCPSATTGTMKGIEEVLKNEYSKEIKVKTNQDSFNILY